MATFKKVLEIGFDVETSNGVKREQFSLFESNIDFEIRFMVDQKIKGTKKCQKYPENLQKTPQKSSIFRRILDNITKRKMGTT